MQNIIVTQLLILLYIYSLESADKEIIIWKNKWNNNLTSRLFWILYHFITLLQS